MIFFVHNENWGKFSQFDEHIFSHGLVQPPTSLVCTDSDGVFELKCPLN